MPQGEVREQTFKESERSKVKIQKEREREREMENWISQIDFKIKQQQLKID